jgi:hypothetical protein
VTTQTRIDRRFAAIKKEGRAALVTFVTAGDPDYEVSKEILLGLPGAGADVIELGMPFSDPMADGPAIQASSQRALAAGHTTRRTLDLVREFRKRDQDTPIVLFGYYNPIYVYPREQFLDDAVSAGADGLLVVDVPPEADEELCLPALERGLSFIRLATPTTDAKRLPEYHGVPVLRLDHGNYRRGGPCGAGSACKGCRIQETHPPSDRRGFWGKNAEAGQSHCPGGRRGRGWLRLGYCDKRNP